MMRYIFDDFMALEVRPYNMSRRLFSWWVSVFGCLSLAVSWRVLGVLERQHRSFFVGREEAKGSRVCEGRGFPRKEWV